MGMGGMGGAGGDTAALVAQVKELQKTDMAAKQAWKTYASKEGGRNLDPARHNAEFLTNFITSYQSGMLSGGGQASGGISLGGAHPDGVVGQIKELQRSNPQVKEAWNRYTELNGENNRDPSRHSQEFLQAFLQHVSSGAAFAEAGASGELGSFIKMLQSRSGKFKQVWASYCQQNGGGKNDPSSYDMVYHVQFFDSVASQYMASESTAKRMRMASPNAALAERVKAFQKSSQENKELWKQYAETYLDGKLDPAKHDASVLQEFCTNHGVPVAPAPAPVGGGMIAGGAAAMSPQKAQLIEKIKAFTKSSPENKEAWCQFIGATKDPARHEAEKLQEFCNTYGL